MPSSSVQLLAERRVCANYPPDTAQRIKRIWCTLAGGRAMKNVSV